jgi:hypothetical protein
MRLLSARARITLAFIFPVHVVRISPGVVTYGFSRRLEESQLGQKPLRSNQSGTTINQHRCSRCQRDFIEHSDGTVQAVYVSTFGFRELPNPINQKWIEEFCPGEPPFLDVAVRREIASRPEARTIWARSNGQVLAHLGIGSSSSIQAKVCSNTPRR